MFNEDSSPTLINVAFLGNMVLGGGRGGGMYNTRGSPTLINVIFSGNFGNAHGGGIYNLDSSPTLTNTTFSGNVAGWDMGAGMYNSGASAPIVRNSIFWGNEGGLQIEWESAAPDVQNSDVQGGITGTGNIDADPQFVRNPDPGDDYWATWSDNDYGDLRLHAASPAIDAGYNGAVPADALDLDDDGNTGEQLPYDSDESWRIVGGMVDMGAFEATRRGCMPLILRGY